MLDLLTLHEAAAALRLSGCAPCDLVRRREVPCARIGGRWLVPLATLAAWVAARVEGAAPPDQPPILAGSDDPLLAWALRESRCGLALLAEGSLAGLDALAECCLVLAALHVPDPGGGGWNVPLIEARMPHARLVAIGLAARTQGLIVPHGNPAGLATVADLARPGPRRHLSRGTRRPRRRDPQHRVRRARPRGQAPRGRAGDADADDLARRGRGTRQSPAPRRVLMRQAGLPNRSARSMVPDRLREISA